MHFAKKDDTNNLWKYATGLRGNDDSGENGAWKEIVVTVIRGDVKEAFSFDSMYAMAWYRRYINTPSDVVRIFDRLFENTHHHAKDHALMAIEALTVYYDSRHGKQYKVFADELRTFTIALNCHNSKAALDSFVRLHKMWG